MARFDGVGWARAVARLVTRNARRGRWCRAFRAIGGLIVDNTHTVLTSPSTDSANIPTYCVHFSPTADTRTRSYTLALPALRRCLAVACATSTLAPGSPPHTRYHLLRPTFTARLIE
jgi:hypothetical protein